MIKWRRMHENLNKAIHVYMYVFRSVRDIYNIKYIIRIYIYIFEIFLLETNLFNCTFLFSAFCLHIYLIQFTFD